MIRTLLSSLLILSITIGSAVAQKKKGKANKGRQPVLDPKKADADYKFQGEYAGELSVDGQKVKYGAQIIALGDGKFRGVGYPGGLPGAGWAGNEKVVGNGTRSGNTVTLKGDEGTGVIKGNSLTITGNDGVELGTLKKTVRKSPTLDAKPPKGAVVLYGGKADAKNWKNGRVAEDGYLMQGITSKQTFAGPFTLHMEFQLSYMPYARGQGRSNSGVYMQGRYEVQILDSFGLAGKHNECGGIYETKDPSLNMCLPPLQWQTYDVEFTPAKYDSAGKKTANARMTVRHNGVLVHKNVEVPKATRAAPVKEGAAPGPIYIQDHRNPLRFRNIWLVEKK